VLDLGYRRTTNSFSFDSIERHRGMGLQLAYGDAVKDISEPVLHFALAAEIARPPPENLRLLSRLSARGSSAWPLGSPVITSSHQHEYDFFSNPAVEYEGRVSWRRRVTFDSPRMTSGYRPMCCSTESYRRESDYYGTLRGDYDYGAGAILSGQLFYKRTSPIWALDPHRERVIPALSDALTLGGRY
jgi:hypothetical protein